MEKPGCPGHVQVVPSLSPASQLRACPVTSWHADNFHIYQFPRLSRQLSIKRHALSIMFCFFQDLESCTQRPPVFNKAAPILYVQRNVDTGKCRGARDTKEGSCSSVALVNRKAELGLTLEPVTPSSAVSRATYHLECVLPAYSQPLQLRLVVDEIGLFYLWELQGHLFLEESSDCSWRLGLN